MTSLRCVHCPQWLAHILFDIFHSRMRGTFAILSRQESTVMPSLRVWRPNDHTAHWWHAFGDLFLLRGFFRQSLEKKHLFSFRVGSFCKWWTGAPTKIKGLCLRSRAEAFQFATLPVASPYPRSWLSLELGEVVRNLSEESHADLCVWIFVCGFWGADFLVRFWCEDFPCGFLCVLFWCGFWRGFFEFFGSDTAEGAIKNPKRILPKILTKSLPGYLPAKPHLDSKGHGCTPGCPFIAWLPQCSSLLQNRAVVDAGLAEQLWAEKDSAPEKLKHGKCNTLTPL